MISLQVFYEGHVQGVGFRFTVRHLAKGFDVTGWVRNLPDGRVEALVEGDAEAVTRVERALRTGPRGARVDRVYVDEEDPIGSYTTFSVTT